MEKKGSISLQQAMQELLKTDLFKEITQRTNKDYAEKLAIWLVRYILVVTSMNEALHISLEKALQDLHGEKFQKILQITNRNFQKTKDKGNATERYIW